MTTANPQLVRVPVEPSAAKSTTRRLLACGVIAGPLFVGGSFTPTTVTSDPNARLSAIGIVFLFLVVALATGYMTRELERERRQAVRRAAQADLLREMSSSIVGDTDIKDVFGAVAGSALAMSGALQGDMVLASPDGFSTRL